MEMQIQSFHIKINLKGLLRKGVILPLFFYLFFCISCSEKLNTIQITGTLEPIGLTSFQYGSHILIREDSLFAIQSSEIDLAEYEFKTVIITGYEVEGYPIENGPMLIEVDALELKDQ